MSPMQIIAAALLVLAISVTILNVLIVRLDRNILHVDRGLTLVDVNLRNLMKRIPNVGEAAARPTDRVPAEPDPNPYGVMYRPALERFDVTFHGEPMPNPTYSDSRRAHAAARGLNEAWNLTGGSTDAKERP